LDPTSLLAAGAAADVAAPPPGALDPTSPLDKGVLVPLLVADGMLEGQGKVVRRHILVIKKYLGRGRYRVESGMVSALPTPSG
jgi:hypothetical protein